VKHIVWFFCMVVLIPAVGLTLAPRTAQQLQQPTDSVTLMQIWDAVQAAYPAQADRPQVVRTQPFTNGYVALYVVRSTDKGGSPWYSDMAYVVPDDSTYVVQQPKRLAKRHRLSSTKVELLTHGIQDGRGITGTAYGGHVRDSGVRQIMLTFRDGSRQTVPVLSNAYLLVRSGNSDVVQIEALDRHGKIRYGKF
jgi:hypothetical protein